MTGRPVSGSVEITGEASRETEGMWPGAASDYAALTCHPPPWIQNTTGRFFAPAGA